MKFMIIVAAAAGLFAGACAKDVSRISAVSVNSGGYRNMSCAELSDEIKRVDYDMSIATEKQKRAQSADAMGVFMLGVPIASAQGGTAEPEIARLKGERIAAGGVAIEKSCPQPETQKNPVTLTGGGV